MATIVKLSFCFLALSLSLFHSLLLLLLLLFAFLLLPFFFKMTEGEFKDCSYSKLLQSGRKVLRAVFTSLPSRASDPSHVREREKESETVTEAAACNESANVCPNDSSRTEWQLNKTGGIIGHLLRSGIRA